MTNTTNLADRLEAFIPDGDGYNSEYAHTLVEAVEALRAAQPSDDVAISKMARILSDRVASACCVDPDDHWKIYSQEFIDDVLAMLEGSKGK